MEHPQGDLAPEMAVDRVKYMYAESVAGGAATVDHHRGLRYTLRLCTLTGMWKDWFTGSCVW